MNSWVWFESYLDGIHLLGRLQGEMSKALKPYKRDKKEELMMLLALGFVRCESHFEFHPNFGSSKIVVAYCIQNSSIIAFCTVRILQNLEHEVKILLCYKHTLRKDHNNCWFIYVTSQNSLGNTRNHFPILPTSFYLFPS